MRLLAEGGKHSKQTKTINFMSENSKWAKEQLSEKQAIEMAKSGLWKNWTAEQVVRFQMFQHRLCMDFSHFHKCVEEVLGRPVYTHEFASSFRDDMVKEYLGVKPAPTLEEIINIIPPEKRIIIGL